MKFLFTNKRAKILDKLCGIKITINDINFCNRKKALKSLIKFRK